MPLGWALVFESGWIRQLGTISEAVGEHQNGPDGPCPSPLPVAKSPVSGRSLRAARGAVSQLRSGAWGR